MEPIYLDYNATTPVDREVAAEMGMVTDLLFGNPSSMHAYGVEARKVVEKARKQVAALLGCRTDEIVFTSGGTESNNFAIKGAAYANRHRGNHIITTAIEHPSVLEVCRYLETQGFTVTYAGVDSTGMTDPSEIENALRPETILISVMHANNETGTVQPVAEIARIAGSHGILLHTDAAQSVGKIPVDVGELGVDLLTLAGHKLYAPKGIGVLYVRRGLRIEKLMHGADHERNMRAGTENVMEIAGLGKAAEMLLGKTGLNAERMRLVRDRLYEEIQKEIPEVRMNGHPVQRLPNTLSLSFPGTTAQAMLSGMKGVAASPGAACHADQVSVSPVLTAMGVPLPLAAGTIRFSVGKNSTETEMIKAAAEIAATWHRLSSARQEQPAPVTGGALRLTEYSHALGCACKIRPQLLEKILGSLPKVQDPNLIVGTETSDDAAVYRVERNLAIVQTVDVIPPIVDDPYAYGAIAAANALSDIYAMGARPLFALSLVCFPDRSIPMEVLSEILKGASDKAREAGIYIVGGHSIEDPEPKFGLTVTGTCHPDKVIRNRGAQPGDVLVLTKPLGTGILTTAMKRGYASEASAAAAVEVMTRLNGSVSELFGGYTIHACTDVTGFGLAGHLKEMIAGSATDAEVGFRKIPLLPEAFAYAEAGMVPGGSLNNLVFASDMMVWDVSIGETEKKVFADAQTSGGLLIALPEREADAFILAVRQRGNMEAAVIGRVVEGAGKIRVR